MAYKQPIAFIFYLLVNVMAVLNSDLYYLLVSTVLLKQRARDLFPGMRETYLGWDTLIRCRL